MVHRSSCGTTEVTLRAAPELPTMHAMTRGPGVRFQHTVTLAIAARVGIFKLEHAVSM